MRHYIMTRNGSLSGFEHLCQKKQNGQFLLLSGLERVVLVITPSLTSSTTASYSSLKPFSYFCSNCLTLSLFFLSGVFLSRKPNTIPCTTLHCSSKSANCFHWRMQKAQGAKSLGCDQILFNRSYSKTIIHQHIKRRKSWQFSSGVHYKLHIVKGCLA